MISGIAILFVLGCVSENPKTNSGPSNATKTMPVCNGVIVGGVVHQLIKLRTGKAYRDRG